MIQGDLWVYMNLQRIADDDDADGIADGDAPKGPVDCGAMNHRSLGVDLIGAPPRAIGGEDPPSADQCIRFATSEGEDPWARLREPFDAHGATRTTPARTATVQTTGPRLADRRSTPRSRGRFCASTRAAGPLLSSGWP